MTYRSTLDADQVAKALATWLNFLCVFISQGVGDDAILFQNVDFILWRNYVVCHDWFRRSRVLRKMRRRSVWLCLQGEVEIPRQRSCGEEVVESRERGKFILFKHMIAHSRSSLQLVDCFCSLTVNSSWLWLLTLNLTCSFEQICYIFWSFIRSRRNGLFWSQRKSIDHHVYLHVDIKLKLRWPQNKPFNMFLF